MSKPSDEKLREMAKEICHIAQAYITGPIKWRDRELPILIIEANLRLVRSASRLAQAKADAEIARNHPGSYPYGEVSEVTAGKETAMDIAKKIEEEARKP